MAAINSTFYKNASTATTGGGGAIALVGPTQGIVQYGTFAANTAAFGAVYDDGAGGGALYLTKTILASNTGGNCAGTLVTNGYNLSNDTYCGGTFDTSQHDLSSANLPLGAYQNNGGLPTIAGGRQPGDQPHRLGGCTYNHDQRAVRLPARPATVAP